VHVDSDRSQPGERSGQRFWRARLHSSPACGPGSRDWASRFPTVSRPLPNFTAR
jgi:hypothetical protein